MISKEKITGYLVTCVSAAPTGDAFLLVSLRMAGALLTGWLHHAGSAPVRSGEAQKKDDHARHYTNTLHIHVEY